MDIESLEPFLGVIPEEARPWAIAAFSVLGVLAFLFATLGAISKGVLAVWRGLRVAARWLWRLIFPPPESPKPPGPEPDPIPEELTIWERRLPVAPLHPIWGERGNVPIITIANMKGGVGKTTLVANLAAHFQTGNQRPVLVIDFDYQGSLSETLSKQSERSHEALRAHTLLAGVLPADQALAHARSLSHGLENVEYYPSRYELATIENNIMIDWAVVSGGADIRYVLCGYLRSRVFQERYSMVLIDCPPRLTTGTINALCASTHLLIPTKLDEMSAEAVVYFLQQTVRMRRSLFPSLRVLGVVPTMTNEAERLADYEERARDRIRFFGSEILGRDDLLMMDQRVPQKMDIGRFAGAGVAYLRRRTIRPIFQRLADEIQTRIDAGR